MRFGLLMSWTLPVPVVSAGSRVRKPPLFVAGAMVHGAWMGIRRAFGMYCSVELECTVQIPNPGVGVRESWIEGFPGIIFFPLSPAGSPIGQKFTEYARLRPSKSLHSDGCSGRSQSRGDLILEYIRSCIETLSSLDFFPFIVPANYLFMCLEVCIPYYELDEAALCEKSSMRDALLAENLWEEF